MKVLQCLFKKIKLNKTFVYLLSSKMSQMTLRGVIVIVQMRRSI